MNPANITIFLIIIFVAVIIVARIRLEIRANRPWTFKKNIIHPKFGLMWYNKPSKSGEMGFYQGHYLFRPANKNVDFMIDSKKESPDELGLSFLSKLEYEYPKLEKKFYTKLEKKRI